jgi:tRNA nucleotidyltransferase (CCA-adding enzyme)
MFNKEITELLSALGRAYIVGGSVRDAFLGFPAKDLDIEVFNTSYEQLIELASQFGQVKTVGKSFGVVKLSHPTLGEVDLSLPRRENRIGVGHRGFKVTVGCNLTLTEAASRRDFTINAMMWGLDGLNDPFSGKLDLDAGILRHVSDKFVEDPLRVLRGMQFCSRFGLEAAPETVNLCRSIIDRFQELSKDRLFIEWEKWAKGAHPSKGLVFLAQTDWIQHFPEITVTANTLNAVDKAAEVCRNNGVSGNARTAQLLAALCDDEQSARSFLSKINCPKFIFEKVVSLVVNRLAHCNSTIKPATVTRLAHKLAPVTIQELAWHVEAMNNGLPQAMQDILNIARSLGLLNSKPEPVLLGRHLIARGLKPGKGFAHILDAAFQAQLDCTFTDLEGAQDWLTKFLQS